MVNRESEDWHSFWRWFALGSGDAPGYTRVLNYWLVLDFAVGIVFVVLFDVHVSQFASGVLLPVSGAFIGISIGAINTAQAVLFSNHLKVLADHWRGGLEDFVFPFLMVILINLVTIIFWALVSTGAFDAEKHSFCEGAALFIGVFFSSLLVRAIWNSMRGVTMFVFAYQEMPEEFKNQNNKSD